MQLNCHFPMLTSTSDSDSDLSDTCTNDLNTDAVTSSNSLFTDPPEKAVECVKEQPRATVSLLYVRNVSDVLKRDHKACLHSASIVIESQSDLVQSCPQLGAFSRKRIYVDQVVIEPAHLW